MMIELLPNINPLQPNRNMASPSTNKPVLCFLLLLCVHTLSVLSSSTAAKDTGNPDLNIEPLPGQRPGQVLLKLSHLFLEVFCHKWFARQALKLQALFVCTVRSIITKSPFLKILVHFFAPDLPDKKWHHGQLRGRSALRVGGWALGLTRPRTRQGRHLMDKHGNWHHHAGTAV